MFSASISVRALSYVAVSQSRRVLLGLQAAHALLPSIPGSWAEHGGYITDDIIQ